MKRCARTAGLRLVAVLLAAPTAGPVQAQEAAAASEPASNGSPAAEGAARSASAEPYAETIPVATQPASAAPQAPPRSQPGRMIEEIVVSARKRDESVQDTPVVVTALSQEQLARYNVDDMTKIAEMTPQLLISKGSNGNGGTLTLRGIGSSSTSSGFDQAVSINIDGIQYSRANVLHQGYFDVGQVEVLKGPQSLFFGKSSSAGVISLSTANPGEEREIRLKAGNEFEASERSAEAVWSGPITDSVGVRLAARYSQSQGYVDNLAAPTTDAANGSTVPAPDKNWPHDQQGLARVTLSYAPSERFDARLKLSYADVKTGGPTQGTELILCEATGSSQLNPGQECVGDYTVAQNPVAPDIARTESAWNQEGGALYSYYKAYTASGTANYHVGDLTLTSVTGYYSFDNQYLGDYEFTAASVIFGTEHPVETAWSQELRLLSDFDSPLNFVLGAYGQRKQFDFGSLIRLLPLPQDPASGRYATWDKVSATQGKAWSGFGQLIWKPLDAWEITGGARYSDERKDSYSVHHYLHPASAALWRPVGDPLTAQTHDTNVSPELTVAWKPGNLMLYASYKKGFKSGGYSNSAILSRSTVPGDATFRPETAAGFEGGIKSSWFDGSLQFNLAAYSYEFKDLQVNFFDASAINFVTQNAAAATTKGAEAEWRWLPPLEGLDLHASASYNKAVYGDFLSFCYSGQSFEDGCNLDANGQRVVAGPGNHQDLSGTIRPLAPEFTVGLGFLYEFALSSSLRMSVSADAGYTDHYLLNSLGRQIYQPGYVRSDASVSLSAQNGRWAIALVGRNLSNEFLVYDEGDSPLSGQGTGQHEPATVVADQIGVVGRPREISLQLTATFGAD